MSKKHTTEFIKEQLEKDDYIPKFTEYLNAHTKLDFICSNGHEHNISWASWKQGQRCGRCKGNIEITYEDVKKSFEGEGYTNLEDDYINSATKMGYICPNGHEHSIKWNDWQQGVRCPHCVDKAKLTKGFIEDELKKEGWSLLSCDYINNSTKLNCLCSKGHYCSISWRGWATGNRCSSCYGNKKLTLDFIKIKFKKDGSVLLSDEYINCEIKLEYICKNEHEHSITWHKWQQGRGCPKCSNNGTSKFEQEIKDFVLSLNQDIIENDRTIILNPLTNNFLELDILLPCKTKAIECNGIYWHKDRKHIDKIKIDQCKELGINLLTITDEVWYNDRKKCEKIIKSFIS